MAKKKEEITIGYDKDGNTCYFGKDGKVVGYAEDNCTAVLKKDFKAEAIKTLIEKDGMTKEEAEKLYKEAYGEPEEIKSEDEPNDKISFSKFGKK